MHVLFVEDDPMNRRVVRDMLSVAGVKMAEAADAETGLAEIEQSSYALVLMDLRMPGMDGLTAIRRVRARSDTKATVPIVVVTADTGVSIRQDCIAAGADDVIMKPVAMETLFEVIGQLVAEQEAFSI